MASASFGWQVYLWRQRRRTSVTVQVIDSVEPRVDDRYLDYILTILVTNSGEQTEYVEAIGIRAAGDGRELSAQTYDSEDLEPHETLPHKMTLGYEIFEELEDREFVGFARLGRREEITSRVQSLRADVVAEYKKRNYLTW